MDRAIENWKERKSIGENRREREVEEEIKIVREGVRFEKAEKDKGTISRQRI
jgi:hypothetical protein